MHPIGQYGQQLRPVLIVLEFAPLTPKNIKTTKPPGKFKCYATSLDPPPPLSGKVGVTKMAPVPEGEMFCCKPVLWFQIQCIYSDPDPEFFTQFGSRCYEGDVITKFF